MIGSRTIEHLEPPYQGSPGVSILLWTYYTYFCLTADLRSDKKKNKYD